MRKVDLSDLTALKGPVREKRSKAKYKSETKETVIAEVMLTNDIGATARKANIPYKTVQQWMKERLRTTIVDEVRQQECRDFVKDAWAAIAKGLKVIDEKIKDSTAKEAAVIVGVLVDKVMRASTSITVTKEVATTSLSVENLPDEVIDLLIQRMAGEPPAVEDAEFVEGEVEGEHEKK